MGAAVVLVVVALSLYQAANPAFWLPVGFAGLAVAPRRWLLLLQGVACQLLAVVLYRWLVLAPIELGGYAENRGTLPEGSATVGRGWLQLAELWSVAQGSLVEHSLGGCVFGVPGRHWPGGVLLGGASMADGVVAYAIAGVLLRNAPFAGRTGVGPSYVYWCRREFSLFGIAGHTRWLQRCNQPCLATCTPGVGVAGHCSGPLGLFARVVCLRQCPKGSATRESVCRHKSPAHLE